MGKPVGRHFAYRAQRIAGQAIQDLYSSPEPMSASKASALASLVSALERLQGRLRHMNGKRRPHRKRLPQVANANGSMPRVGQASSVPVPSQVQVGSGSDSEPDPNS